MNLVAACLDCCLTFLFRPSRFNLLPWHRQWSQERESVCKCLFVADLCLLRAGFFFFSNSPLGGVYLGGAVANFDFYRYS